MECLHGRFSAEVNVNRLQKGFEAHPENRAENFSAGIKIKCDECGIYFEFIGMPVGFSFREPSISADGTEARMPIKPGKSK